MNEKFQEKINRIKQVISDYFNRISSYFNKIFHGFLDFFKNLKTRASTMFQAFLQRLSHYYTKLKQRLQPLLGLKVSPKNLEESTEAPPKEPTKASARKSIKESEPFMEMDENFISDSKAALNNEGSPRSDKTIMVIAIFFLVAIIWAYFSEIDQIVSGNGVVIPSSHVKVIQSYDGGILKEVRVQEGQIVNKDQTLLVLDDTRYKAEYKQLYEHYLSLLATIARLTAETGHQDTIKFPKEVSDKKILVETEISLFETRKKSLKEEISILQKSYDLAEQEIKMYEPLIGTGSASQLELLRAQRSANELKSKIIEKEGNFREEAWTELNKNLAELASTQERLLGLRDKMIDTTIVSPVHGIIKDIKIVTLGGVVKPGDDIMEIVPLEDTMLVQVKVNSSDIAFLTVGTTASVKIDAYDYSIFGDLKGKIEYISADIVEENKNAPSSSLAAMHPTQQYIVHVRTSKDYILYHGKQLPIIPGMTARIQFTVNKRTVLQYIFKPIIKVKTEALGEK